MRAEVTHPARRSSIYRWSNKGNAVFCLPLISESRWRRQSHVKPAVGEDVPEDGAEHKQGVDKEKDPKQGLLLEPLLVVLQDHHTQRQTNHHPTQVSYEAGIGARRGGGRVEPQPHRPTKLYTHCEWTDRERGRNISRVEVWYVPGRNQNVIKQFLL